MCYGCLVFPTSGWYYQNLFVKEPYLIGLKKIKHLHELHIHKLLRNIIKNQSKCFSGSCDLR